MAAMVGSLPVSLQAAFWGFVAGSALVIGALIGIYARLPQRIIAGVMAFGSGTLISALSFELMDEAYKQGGFDSTALGFVGGAMIYTFANLMLSRYGARHRKRATKEAHEDSSVALAIGALIDGIPESIVIGISMIAGAKVSWVAVVAIFLSNIPESLSSAAGMKKGGRSTAAILLLWSAIAGASAVASWAGYVFFGGFSPEIIAAITAVAAGGILAMLADTMIPEAFEEAHDYAGLITVFGFLTAFILSKLD